MVRKILRLRPSDYYLTHLRLVNAVMPVRMTEKQLEVLAEFMAQDSFDSRAKKAVRDKLNLTPPNLSNHIKELVLKGFVIQYMDERARRRYKLHDLIKIKPDQTQYQFLLVNEDKTSANNSGSV